MDKNSTLYWTPCTTAYSTTPCQPPSQVQTAMITQPPQPLIQTPLSIPMPPSIPWTLPKLQVKETSGKQYEPTSASQLMDILQAIPEENMDHQQIFKKKNKILRKRKRTKP